MYVHATTFAPPLHLTGFCSVLFGTRCCIMQFESYAHSNKLFPNWFKKPFVRSTENHRWCDWVIWATSRILHGVCYQQLLISSGSQVNHDPVDSVGIGP